MYLYKNLIKWVSENFICFDKLNSKFVHFKENKLKSFILMLKEEREAMAREYDDEDMDELNDSYYYDRHDDSYTSSINPASGCIMTGSVDTMGNAYGTSSYHEH